MPLQQIPLSPLKNQKFQITLTIDGQNVTREYGVTYNEMANVWFLSISDTQGNLLLDSVPLVTGGPNSNNILRAHSHLGLGSAYIVNASNTAAMDYPNAATLGTDFVLIVSDTE